MKLFSFVILITLLLAFSCNHREPTKKIVVINKEYKDSIALSKNYSQYGQLLTYSDSLYAENPDKNYYHFAAQKLIDSINSQSNKPPITKDILKYIEIKNLNKDKIVIIDFNPNLYTHYHLNLYILDSLQNILTSMIFPGCHYNNGTITTADFDSDSTDEICFKINWPTQSVPVIRTTHEYYKLIDNKLRNIFSLVTDDRDATVTEHKYGIQILRDYRFSKNIITVTEQEYRYNPENFKFDEEILPKELIKKSTYQFTFNPDSVKYINNNAL